MASRNIEPVTKTAIGDVDADTQFEASLAKLTPFLRGFSMSLARQRELAEDLAQEALAKAWRSRRSFVPGSNLKAWLFTILRNEYFSQQRRAWRQVDWDVELGNNIPSHSEEQHWALELSDMTRAMQDLPDTQREALILVGVGGFSYEDAAALSKSAVGTVKSRVARARQALKGILDGHRPLPAMSRHLNGNAMNELFAHLGHLIRIDKPRADARPALR